jgi:RNA polymerase sigma-70 factor (ECF subfamily)
VTPAEATPRGARGRFAAGIRAAGRSGSARPEAPLTLHVLPHPADEQALVHRAASGDPTAKAELIERIGPVVQRFCLRLMGDAHDARDASQDALIKILRNLHRYDPRWRFHTWALTVARNACVDELRRRKRRAEVAEAEVSSDAPSPFDELHRSAEADRVHAALQRVPPLYREVLILYHFEHLKYVEIADVLELPLGTVMNRIFRARKKMREAWDALDATAARGAAATEVRA